MTQGPGGHSFLKHGALCAGPPSLGPYGPAPKRQNIRPPAFSQNMTRTTPAPKRQNIRPPAFSQDVIIDVEAKSKWPEEAWSEEMLEEVHQVPDNEELHEEDQMQKEVAEEAVHGSKEEAEVVVVLDEEKDSAAEANGPNMQTHGWQEMDDATDEGSLVYFESRVAEQDWQDPSMPQDEGHAKPDWQRESQMVGTSPRVLAPKKTPVRVGSALGRPWAVEEVLAARQPAGPPRLVPPPSAPVVVRPKVIDSSRQLNGQLPRLPLQIPRPVSPWRPILQGLDRLSIIRPRPTSTITPPNFQTGTRPGTVAANGWMNALEEAQSGNTQSGTEAMQHNPAQRTQRAGQSSDPLSRQILELLEVKKNERAAHQQRLASASWSTSPGTRSLPQESGYWSGGACGSAPRLSPSLRTNVPQPQVAAHPEPQTSYPGNDPANFVNSIAQNLLQDLILATSTSPNPSATSTAPARPPPETALMPWTGDTTPAEPRYSPGAAGPCTQLVPVQRQTPLEPTPSCPYRQRTGDPPASPQLIPVRNLAAPLALMDAGPARAGAPPEAATTAQSAPRGAWAPEPQIIPVLQSGAGTSGSGADTGSRASPASDQAQGWHLEGKATSGGAMKTAARGGSGGAEMDFAPWRTLKRQRLEAHHSSQDVAMATPAPEGETPSAQAEAVSATNAEFQETTQCHIPLLPHELAAHAMNQSFVEPGNTDSAEHDVADTVPDLELTPALEDVYVL